MNGQTPPELIILKNKFNEFKNKLNKIPYLIVPAIIVVIILFTMFFQVQPEEDAVVQRFGKYVRTAGPGLHFKLPIGMEKVTKVKTRIVLKQEFGFSTVRAGIQTEYDRSDRRQYRDESTMLTGDLNVADVEWIVQYKISDPKAYLFNTRRPGRIIRDISEAVMRQIVGDKKVTEVLTYGRMSIEEAARDNLQKILDLYKTGIHIVTVKLQDVNPPEAVKPSFNEVNAAKQESDQLVNEAWKAYNKVIPEARGKAGRTIANAEGYAIERINNAKGDSKRFMALLREYSKAPRVTRKRLYLETVQDVLGKVDQIYVVDPKLKSIVPLLNMGGKATASTSS